MIASAKYPNTILGSADRRPRRPRAGIALPCPKCGAIGSSGVSSGDPAGLVFWLGDGLFRCESCGEEITRGDVHEIRRLADVVLAMLDAATTA